MIRALYTKKGFTLIELMIVVAIIGILAAIAIPNFLRFQAKSRQAEAKTNLGGLFTSEESYRAEFNSYTTDLIQVGWAPSGSPRYLYGFTTAGATAGTGSTAAANREVIGAGICSAGGSCNSANVVKSDGTTVYGPGDLPTGTTAQQTQYTVGAVGNIDNDVTDDWWTMTFTRVLTNVAGNQDVSQ
jgi:type IV pilus assembly protein PilA